MSCLGTGVFPASSVTFLFEESFFSMCDQDTPCSLGINMGSRKMWRWYSWWLLFGTTYWTHSLMKSPSAPNTLWECLQAPKTTCRRDWSIRDPYNFNPSLPCIQFDIYFMYRRLSYFFRPNFWILCQAEEHTGPSGDYTTYYGTLRGVDFWGNGDLTSKGKACCGPLVASVKCYGLLGQKQDLQNLDI